MYIKVLLFLLLFYLNNCFAGNFNGYTYSKEFRELEKHLTTPELIDKYTKKNFKYGKGCGNKSIYYGLKKCNPEYIFKTKVGNCGAFSKFVTYFLRKAHYNAIILKVYSPWPKHFIENSNASTNNYYFGDYHYLVAYKKNEKWFIIDNGRKKPLGIRGPYRSLDKVISMKDQY